MPVLALRGGDRVSAPGLGRFVHYTAKHMNVQVLRNRSAFLPLWGTDGPVNSSLYRRRIHLSKCGL